MKKNFPICKVAVDFKQVHSGWDKIKATFRAIAGAAKCIWEIDGVKRAFASSALGAIASGVVSLVGKIFGAAWLKVLYHILKDGYDVYRTIRKALDASDERVKYFSVGKAFA
jgi:hypothetical protein